MFPHARGQHGKKRKTILCTDQPQIAFKKGLFIVDYGDVKRAYTPDVFIMAIEDACTVLREWQRSKAGVVPMRFVGKR